MLIIFVWVNLGQLYVVYTYFTTSNTENHPYRSLSKNYNWNTYAKVYSAYSSQSIAANNRMFRPFG